MFKTNLSQLKLFGLLLSERMLAEHLKLLFCSGGFLGKKSESVLNILLSELKDKYGHRIRKYELENAVGKIFNDECLPNFSYLDHYCDELFDIHFDKVSLKDGKEEEFAKIAKDFNPLIIIAHKVVSIYRDGNGNQACAEHIISHMTPLGICRASDKEYAENHMHLGGASDPSSALMILAEQQPDKKLRTKIKNRNVNSYPDSDYSLENLIVILKYLYGALNNSQMQKNETILSNTYMSELQFYLESKNTPIFRKSSFFSLKLLRNVCGFNRFFGLAYEYYQKNEYHKSFFAYVIWLFDTYYNSKSAQEKRVVAIILLVFGRLRSDMVMSNVTGLENFIDFYDSSIRKLSNKSRHIESTIFQTGVTHIEYKCFEDVINNKILSDQYKSFTGGIAARLAETNGCSNEDKLINRGIFLREHPDFGFQFCYHVIKEKDNSLKHKQKTGIKKQRHFETRNKIFANMKQLRKYLHSCDTEKSIYKIYAGTHFDKLEFQTLKRELKETKIDLRKMLRAVDAAGNEILMPPEVYAPYMRYLRKCNKKETNSDHAHLKKLTFAFHAGEDFSHIATGMRRVDETVNFLEYEKGDRLGHALAIGISPHEWADKGEACMKIGNRLDDIVWLWSIAIEMCDPIAEPLAKIAWDMGNKLYGAGWTIYNAYEAYKLRKYCPIKSLQVGTPLSGIVAFNKNDFSKEIVDLFRLYHCDVELHNKLEQTLIVRKSNPLGADTISDAELDFLMRVQEYITDKYAKTGIIIETNLSSNIYIDTMNGTRKHPILRWCSFSPDETDKIKVCINTDDPGIFPTTLQNEFTMLRNVLVNKLGHNAMYVDKKIEDLRLFNLEVFKSNHIRY